MKIIICTTFMLVLSLTSSLYANELTLKEIQADLKQASQHFNYGLDKQEKKTLELARVPQKNKVKSQSEAEDLEAEYFDTVNTARAARKRVRE